MAHITASIDLATMLGHYYLVSYRNDVARYDKNSSYDALYEVLQAERDDERRYPKGGDKASHLDVKDVLAQKERNDYPYAHAK